jgi:formate dehydrogenase alpha subunit
VVEDIFLTETAEMADVVLPAACWAEKEGTFTNSERKVQRVRKAVEPPPEARPDWMILSEIGRRLGIPMDYSSAEDVFNEMADLTPSYYGIRYERIDKRDLQWPCPSADHEGTQFLHQGKFTRGVGLFHAIDYRPSEELPDEEYPFILTTGRRYAHYHTRTMTGRCSSLHKEIPQPITQINERDAAKLGLKAGDPARVISRRGEVVTFVRPGDIVPEGAIFMDFHFAEANSNVLLGTSLDPVSKTPDYKVCAVRIEKPNGDQIESEGANTIE